MIGTILGNRYEILEEIGKGGMAHVYKARCTLLNRIVAIKMLRDDLDESDQFLQRFNLEAHAAARLTHPNIVGIFDVGTDGDKHYIVMEYVEGTTLKNYILNNGKIEYKEALKIAYQISDALGAAHNKNIVHRDIKPHNILITDDGNVKVTDFGIARSTTTNTISKDNDILGSVHYISPQQAKGEMVDHRSDLYSLGIVLYEMVTGKVPFDADTPVRVAMMQIDETAKSLDNFISGFPIGLEQIIFKAIEKNPSDRYQSALGIKSDILKLLNDKNYLLYKENVSKKLKPKDKEEVKIEKSTKRLVVLFSLLSAVIVVVLGIMAYNGTLTSIFTSGFSQNIKVPKLEGLTLDEAQNECNKLSLNLIVKDEISNDNYAPGTIISQTPEYNKDVKDGSKIYVVINKSLNTSRIKNYKGEDYVKSKEELEKLGYNVNVVYEESREDEDVILRQSPNAGTSLNSDDYVTFYVSKGLSENNSYKTVPNLNGSTFAKCKELLKSAELNLGNITGTEHPLEDDVVIEQSIPSGSMVIKGCTINITIKPRDDVNQDNPSSESPSDIEELNDARITR